MTDLIPVSIIRSNAGPISKPTTGFHFVDQGNYLTLPISIGTTLYSDSATSCIITIVLAKSGKEITATLAHLDSPQCIEKFFDIIAARQNDQLQIYAQGANPPENKTAQENAAALQQAISRLNNVVVAELFLCIGNPRQENLGHFGLSVGADQITVTNQPYNLTLIDRDPTCGGQSVYCIMRRQENPPMEIRDAGIPFTHTELVELSTIALAFKKDPNDPSTAFCNIVNMENDKILEQWSTTPQFEAPWFSDELKQGACFAISMAPIVALSAHELKQKGPQKYARLSNMLLS